MFKKNDLSTSKLYSLRNLIIFLVIFISIGTYVVIKSSAANPIVASLLADQMSLSPGSTIVSDSNASTGKAVAISAKYGEIRGSVNIPSTVTALSVTARSPACSVKGSTYQTKMNVYLDSSLVVSVSSIGTSYTNYNSGSLNIPSGTHNLSIELNNPNTACNHVLYVDVTDFYGPTPPPPVPTVAISATPSTVNTGGSSTLTWSSTNATTCSASGAWSGTEPTSGSLSTGALNTNSTYSLTCTGTGGSATGATSVTVQGGSGGNGSKMFGINGVFDNGNYDYNLNVANMGASWQRTAVWGDDAAFEYTGCGGSSDTTGTPPDNPAVFLPSGEINSANCGIPRTLTLLASHQLGLLPIINDYGTDFVNQGGCSISGDSYTQCLAACSNPAQVTTVKCSDQLDWVQNAVHYAVTYAKGGTFWQGKTDYGSPVLEMGNEVYLGASTNGGTNGVCGPPYYWPDDSCQNPGAYAKMLELASVAVTNATGGNIKLLASQIPLYMSPDGTQHHWLADMQAEVPNIESYLGGVVSHPYGDIPADPSNNFPGVCDEQPPNNNPCFNYTPLDWTYKTLAEVHSEWSIPVYVTEVGQEVTEVGTTQQCQAMNYYLQQFKQNSWEAGLFYYSQKEWDYSPGFSILYGLGNPGSTTPAWYAYQASEQNKNYSCPAAPNTPTGFTASSVGNNTVTLKWQADSDPSGPGIAGYDILENGNAITQVNSSTISYNISNLNPNLTYTFSVQAFDTASIPNISVPATTVSVANP